MDIVISIFLGLMGLSYILFPEKMINVGRSLQKRKEVEVPSGTKTLMRVVGGFLVVYAYFSQAAI